jgi:hypothetical protein
MQLIVSLKVAEWKSRANGRFKYLIVFRIGKQKKMIEKPARGLE